MHRLLAPGLGGVVKRGGQCRIGCQAGNDLHQRHQRRRVEEVHADHVLGALQAGGEAGDRQRRGVAGQDAVFTAEGFKLA
ncbi:hypothetical protein D3C76_435660 [compost metagenome]